MGVPPDFFGQGYCWMHSLEIAVKGTGTLDNTKIRDCLQSCPIDVPYGKGIQFDSRGLPSPYALTVQTLQEQKKLLLPKESAQTKLVYPRPAWGK
jgi:hypothetical protein